MQSFAAPDMGEIGLQDPSPRVSTHVSLRKQAARLAVRAADANSSDVKKKNNRDLLIFQRHVRSPGGARPLSLRCVASVRLLFPF